MPFRYWRDPLFAVCLAGYVINRLLLKPNLEVAFLHEHLNDLLCIPFWVPIMLWLQHLVGLRKVPSPPSAGEIIIPLLLWSWAFELWLPNTAWGAQHCTADPLDILFYAAGALGAACFWHRRRLFAARPTPSKLGG